MRNKTITDSKKIAQFFERNIDECVTRPELEAKLKSGRQLIIKIGIDPTSPLLHLGHAVNLWKMRELQELGHKVVFLIGDFTCLIGDPTGRTKARPVLSREEIEKNAKDYQKQAEMILLKDPKVFEVRRNSEWYRKMPLEFFLSLLAMITHQKLIQREMFQKRIKAGEEIYMHEILYPILQSYDSVMLKSDVTVIGSDQLFNEMIGRFYQERFSQTPQSIVTTVITPGIDGIEKMSKSLGNYIALLDSAEDKFGKIMSIPDNLIPMYMKVYTKIPLKEVDEFGNKLERSLINPRDAKLRLAFEVVKLYHGEKAAGKAQEEFTKVFAEKQKPSEVGTKKLEIRNWKLVDLLVETGLAKSKGEARRLIIQGGVKVDDVKKTDPNEIIEIKKETIVQVGPRHFLKVVGS